MQKISVVKTRKTHPSIENAKSAERKLCMQLKECAGKSEIRINNKFTFSACYSKHKFQKNKMDKSKHITCKCCEKMAPHHGNKMCK
jgi:hypothetical protein